jgi:ssDNA-binding Zn-finger/Zn-ribbon topoisomerase 1
MRSCPRCGKHSIDTHTMEMNAEHYGSSNFHVQCPKCKGMVVVSVFRQVVIGSVLPSSRNPADADF